MTRCSPGGLASQLNLPLSYTTPNFRDLSLFYHISIDSAVSLSQSWQLLSLEHHYTAKATQMSNTSSLGKARFILRRPDAYHQRLKTGELLLLNQAVLGGMVGK